MDSSTFAVVKNPENQYHIYLSWPRYLAQWYAHEMYRLRRFDDEHLEPFCYNCDLPAALLQPVETRRGSVERNVLEMFQAKRPKDYVAKPPHDATICLVIPYFVSKPPQTYCYLAPKGAALLEQSVRNHFRVELARYVGKFNSESLTKESIVQSFLEYNGIEDTETNLFAVMKVWQRLAACRRMSQYRKKSKKQ